MRDLNKMLLWTAQYVRDSDTFDNSIYFFDDNFNPGCVGAHAINLQYSFYDKEEKEIFIDSFMAQPYETVSQVLSIELFQAKELCNRQWLYDERRVPYSENHRIDGSMAFKALCNLATLDTYKNPTRRVDWFSKPRIEWKEDYMFYTDIYMAGNGISDDQFHA